MEMSTKGLKSSSKGIPYLEGTVKNTQDETIKNT